VASNDNIVKINLYCPFWW